MVDTLAGAKAVHVISWVFKEGLVADLAWEIAIFTLFFRVVLSVDLLHCLQFNSLLTELNLSSFVCFLVSLISLVTNSLGQSFVVLLGDVFEVRILS